MSDEAPQTPRTPPDEMQRVRVGVTGLAAVLLLIALATAIASGLRGLNDTTPGNAAGVANMANAGEPTGNASDPLADLGAGPGAGEQDKTAGK